MKSTTAAWMLTAATAVAAVAGIFSLSPPRALPADAPAERFSATRALEHVREIAREPHAIGTAAHARVRVYLEQQAAALGLETEVQETTETRVAPRGPIYAARLSNVLARLRGSQGGPALLLVAHYDSVVHSHGAADDGAGVAALLETMRALGAAEAPRRDVVFLFADGEEAGLLGARAFLSQHPWAEDVALVLNFEARGTEGPTLMFETSEGNGRLISALAAAVPFPVATSYSYEIYKALPNDTDFSVFRRAGLPGLNFAFIHGATGYHTLQDSVERLDPASLQHMGDAALGLARHLAAADLEASWQAPNATYFNLFGPLFVRYPQGLATASGGVIALLTVVFLALGVFRRRLSVGRLLLALFALLLGAVIVGAAFSWISRRVMSIYSFSLAGGWTSHALDLLALALVAVALALAFGAWLRPRVGAGNLAGAGLLLWAALLVAMLWVAPGAGYLFAWPLVPALGAAFLGWREGGEPAEGAGGEAPIGAVRLLLLVLLALLAGLLWAPTLSLIGVALGGPASVLIGALAFLLVAGLLLPPAGAPALSGRRWPLPALAVALGLVLLVVSSLGSKHGERNRRMSSVLYALDLDAPSALWLSFDRRPDRWTEQFLGDSPQRAPSPGFVGFTFPTLRAEAPVLALGGPRVEVLSEELGTEERPEGWAVELSVSWPSGAERAILTLGPGEQIRSLAIDGRPAAVDGSAERLRVFYYAPPADGLHLRLALAEEVPLELGLTGQRFSLPEAPGEGWQPRPADTMPSFGWSSDSTFVYQSHTVEPGMAAPPEEEGEGEVAEGAGESA